MTSPGNATKISADKVAQVIEQHLQVEQDIGKYVQQLEDEAGNVHSSSGSSMTNAARQQAEQLREQCRNAVSQPIQEMTENMKTASSSTTQTDQDIAADVAKASSAMASHLS